ncbi:MAG TPA: iron-containing alcohol dehydrogenase [Firmicutes bacterium]|nr:iron-containing alcohol dehydrogenase [Bacillota bacterium]
MKFKYFIPTKVYFGKGEVERVGELGKKFGKKAFIVTGKKSAKESGVLDRVTGLLEKNGISYEIFNETVPNPPVQLVKKGGEKFLSTSSDFIIAIGGGSPMDLSKGIGIYSVYKEIVPFLLGEKRVERKIPPLIAIPTTSGTGSEVTRYAVLTYEGRKLAVGSEYIFPDVALVDPETTLSMPKELARDTGMDALSHALEGLFSLKANSVSDSLAYESIRIIFDFLPRSVFHEGDLEAREMMHYASMVAGMVIAETGTGLVHSMGYPLTMKYGFSHGLANAIIMPYVMKYNIPACYEKMANVVRIISEYSGIDIEDAYLLPEVLLDMNELLEIPITLDEAGVDEKDFEKFAREVMDSMQRKPIPRKPEGIDEVIAIYQESFYGLI